MYQHGLGAAFVAERAARTAHPGYAILTRSGASAKASEGTAQSLNYPDSLSQQSFGDL